MALDVPAVLFLLRHREHARSALAAAIKKFNEARGDRDAARAMLDKIDAALAPFDLSLAPEISPFVTLDDVIARLTPPAPAPSDPVPASAPEAGGNV